MMMRKKRMQGVSHSGHGVYAWPCKERLIPICCIEYSLARQYRRRVSERPDYFSRIRLGVRGVGLTCRFFRGGSTVWLGEQRFVA